MRRQSPPYEGLPATMFCHVEGGLLRSSSCFPYFMVVALERGSLLRALLLLLLYPVLALITEDLKIRAMTIISFCGVHVSSFKVGTTVLPKHLMENVGKEGFETLMAEKYRKVCVSKMPRVMVEEFLKKYLQVETVMAREIKVAFGFYTGFMEDIPIIEERIVAVRENEKSQMGKLKEDYPEPLIFHDGRLAFRATPLSSIAMFVWLPFGFCLSFIRVFLFFLLLLPYNLYAPALALSGIKCRLKKSSFHPNIDLQRKKQGRLFVCNHRTLLDHLFISLAVGYPITSLVYGVSASTRLFSPLRTVALRRIKEHDRTIMEEEIRRDDVVLCPEGTTCREPFVLRFSPLFAEIVEEIFPVAISCYSSFFHGTTVNGLKAMDPLALLANPRVCYTVEFLERVEVGPGKSSSETANRVQEAIAGALGFRCSLLSRKDKYRYLAGTDGIYQVENPNYGGR